MTRPTTAVRAVEVIRPGGEYRSLERVPLPDVTGRPVAELGLAPPLLVRQVLREMRSAPDQAYPERLAALARAGELFAAAALDGETPQDYCALQARVSGVPRCAAERALGVIARAAAALPDSVAAQLPAGTYAPWSQAPAGGAAVWTPRGRVLAVLAPGNHPLPHAEWLTAVALGYRVAVRPSHRDPFTPRRLVRALRTAGLGRGHAVLLPTDHPTADVLRTGADLAWVHGDARTVRRHLGDPRVKVLGPGRCTTLITRDTDWRDHLGLLVDAIAADGGTQCLNTTTVLVEGTAAAREVAAALDAELRTLPDLPPHDPMARLPVCPAGYAERLAKETGCAFADLGDGSAVLRPHVRYVTDPPPTAAHRELPFPCAWVAAWDRTEGTAPLRHSLVVTLLTDDARLVADCLREPSVRNVHWGVHPTTEHPTGLPHDGHPAAFLMEAKTFLH